MYSLLTLFIIIITIPLIFGFGENNNWGCNHYNDYPIDVCFKPYSMGIQKIIKYTCNNDGTKIKELLFDDINECYSTDISEYSGSIYEIDITSNIDAECDNTVSCEYYSIETTYDNVLYMLFPINVCYLYSSPDSSSTYKSMIYTCDGSILTTERFDSDDCSGVSNQLTSFDFSNYYNLDQHTVKFYIFIFLYFYFCVINV